MRRYRWEIAILLLLLLGTVAVFFRVLQADFVQWDDDTLLYQNPHLTGFNAASVKWAFTAFDYVVRYQPLTWLTWAAIREYSGLNPFGYHLASLLFHAANTGLVFLLLRRLLGLCVRDTSLPQQERVGRALPSTLPGASRSSGAPGTARPTSPSPDGLGGRWLSIWAGFGALLWAIHPLRVEAVAWASAMLHGQALFFLFLSTLAYLEAACAAAQTKRQSWFYWTSVLGFACSLFSYPIGLGYVVVLLALDVYPLRRFNEGPGRWLDATALRIGLEKLPFIAVAGLCVGITMWARLNVSGGWIEAASLSEFGLAHRAMQAAYIWAYYVWKPWWPTDLAPVYTTLLNFRPTDSAFVQSAIFLALITFILFLQRREWPAALPLWFSYLAFMVPVLGLTEHPHYANDRYGNLAGVLWSIALAAAAIKWCRAPRSRWLTLTCCVMVAMGLVASSARQIGIWRNSSVLLDHLLVCLADHPYRFDIHWRKGRLLADQGRLDEAITQYQASLAIVPDFADAHFHLGVALERQGKADLALQEFAGTLRIRPGFAEAHMRMGILLAERGRKEEAIAHLRQAVQLDPKLGDARRRLSELAP